MKLYEKITYRDNSRKIIKFLGLTIIDKQIKKDETTRKILYGLFKIKKTLTRKYYYFLGLKLFSIKRKNSSYLQTQEYKYLLQEIRQIVLDETRVSNAIAFLHSQVFPQFKNCNNGKDIVIVGTGPTLNYYTFDEKLVHVGLNRAFLAPNINKLDYSFIIHYNETSSTYIEKLMTYDCIKFLGQYHLKKILDWNIPNKYENFKNTYRYYIDRTFHPNIETQGLFDPGSIAFSALHFSLYTHPKRIFLVGCDCSENGYYDKTVEQVKWLGLPNTLKNYPILKNIAQIYYPDIEIISVNPIGLKGLFRDVYTKSYVTENPELFIGFEDKIEYFEDIVQVGGNNE